MKKFLAYILIIIFLGAGAYKFKDFISDQTKNRLMLAVEERNWKNITEAPGKCDKPFAYSIGNIDSRFDISQEVVIDLSQKAEAIWDGQTAKDLFEYDPNSSFKINLVFDERQAETNEAEALEQKLKKMELSDAGLKKQYDAIYADYSRKVDGYNALGKKYGERIKEYNADVKKWNKKGGAPPEEFKKLDDEKDELEAMYKSLEKKRKEINKLAGQLNSLSSKEKQIINSYNAAVNTYRDKYGAAREFEKGVYNGAEINIYQFNEEADLRLTIAHELGHALGIGHLENPASLMYYLMADQDMENPKLTQEDIQAVEIVCAE